jgi:hypothetical protein
MVKMIPNNNIGMSMEGAYDEAIEVAARRIHLAIRPTPHETAITASMNANNSSSGSSSLSENNDSTSDDNDSSEQDQVLADGTNDSMNDSYDSNDDDDDDDNIESTIQFLEEKILILKKVEARRKNEEAYIAYNAHEIMNGREPSHTNHVKSSSVWSEAKDLLEEYKIGVGGQDEVIDVDAEGEQQQQKRSLSPQPPPQQLQEPSSNNYYNNILSLGENFFPRPSQQTAATATDGEPKKKRIKIDLSFVHRISSTRFDVEGASGVADFVGDARTASTTEMPPPPPTNNKNCPSSANLQNYDCFNLSSNIRCQQASDMQFATASRHWISQAVLHEISTITNNAIAKHRLSLIEE